MQPLIYQVTLVPPAQSTLGGMRLVPGMVGTLELASSGEIHMRVPQPARFMGLIRRPDLVIGNLPADCAAVVQPFLDSERHLRVRIVDMRGPASGPDRVVISIWTSL